MWEGFILCRAAGNVLLMRIHRLAMLSLRGSSKVTTTRFADVSDFPGY